MTIATDAIIFVIALELLELVEWPYIYDVMALLFLIFNSLLYRELRRKG